MSLLLPWLAWRKVTMTPAHWLGLAFLAYVAGSTAWTPASPDVVMAAWLWALLALSFLWGSRLSSLRPFWKGLAIGCGISSIVAIAQWLGAYDIVLTSNWAKPPGLFFNNATAGAVAAIVIVGLASEGMWYWIVAIMPLIVLSQSRGAWVALVGTWLIGVFVTSHWRERVILLACVSVASIALVFFFTGNSDIVRLTIWSYVVSNLTIFGHGIGSAQSIYLLTHEGIDHVGHAHNDYLTLLHQYGIGVVPLFLMVSLLAGKRDETTWYPYICGLLMCAWFGTLESPVTGFILCVVAGHLAACIDVAWCHRVGRRFTELLRAATWKHRAGATGVQPVSV